MEAIHIDGKRLWQTLEDMARIGPGVAGGSRRLALTDEDKEGRDLFVSWAREAGCSIRVDEMGNIFARRPGTDPDAAPVLVGSHLDTQPTGGRYDGVYGVLAGLEIVRHLNDKGVETRRPIEVVCWTNEEGSRYQPAMNGSGVFAGAMDKQASLDRTDRDGARFGDELARIGYQGETPCAAFPIHAYLEAHIEQGPVLEAEQKLIGVVTGIQGVKWFKASVSGLNAHAGTTPMPVRRDPLVGASRMIDAADRLVRELAPEAVVTVGEMAVSPGSINVINERVDFSLDLRNPDAEVLASLQREVTARMEGIAADMGLAFTLEEIWYAPPTHFASAIADVVEQCATAEQYPHRRIVSGAGHDAKYLADVCPTGMVFIPCRDGISHNEAEDVEPEHATAGANVLAAATVALANQA